MKNLQSEGWQHFSYAGIKIEINFVNIRLELIIFKLIATLFFVLSESMIN